MLRIYIIDILKLYNIFNTKNTLKSFNIQSNNTLYDINYFKK